MSSVGSPPPFPTSVNPAPLPSDPPPYEAEQEGAEAAAAESPGELHISKVNVLVEQNLKVTDNQRSDITELITRLNSLLSEFIRQSGSLEQRKQQLEASFAELEKSVNAIHPLAFLATILKDKKLKKSLKSILHPIFPIADLKLVSQTFIVNLSQRLNDYVKINNPYRFLPTSDPNNNKYLNFVAFYNELGLQEETRGNLHEPTRSGDWKNFMKILLKC